MRAVVQRVTSAAVTVVERDASREVGRIEAGLLVFLGVEQEDGLDDVRYIAGKVQGLRIFEGAGGKMDRAITELDGAVLVVSQFTLAGDCRKGRRPSFDAAAPPGIAKPLYEAVVGELVGAGLKVQTGEFQAMMRVALVNDGPVTVLLDSRRRF